MAEITVTVKFFGAFRTYGENISFPLPSGSSVREVKAGLQGALKADAALICDSVIADDDSILGDDAVFTDDVHLAILPPVCGG